MINDIFENILEIMFHLIVEIICFYTGEIVIFFLTFGNRKPRWDFYTDDTPIRWAIFTQISVWIGMFFWIFIIVIIVRILT